MKRGKKRNSDIRSIQSDTAERIPVMGVFEGHTAMMREDGSPVLGSYGQALGTIELVNPETGEIRKYWADGGLRGALKMSKVQKGDRIEIVHTGERKIEFEGEDGRTQAGKVQTYDIFDLE